MRIDVFFRNLLIGLIAFYFAQGDLYAEGSIASQSALVIVLIISLVYFLKVILLKNKELFVNVWTALLILNVIGFIFARDSSNLYNLSSLKGICITLLPFYPFYYFALKGALRAEHLIMFFLMMLPISILSYYFNQTTVLAIQSLNNTTVVNNITFTFVALIPFVFLFKHKKVYAFSFMMILIYFIIMGSKRGALFSGAAGILLFFYFQLQTIKKGNRLKGFAFALIGIIALGYFANNLFADNRFLISRMVSMEQGDSSARNIIFINLLHAWFNSDSFFHFLFGFGFNASLRLSGTGNFAHNDWLELLSNFGLVGVSIYVLFFYAAIKCIKYPWWKKQKKILMATIMTIWFLNSLTTPGYNSTDNYSMSILLAYMVGNKSGEIT